MAPQKAQPACLRWRFCTLIKKTWRETKIAVRLPFTERDRIFNEAPSKHVLELVMWRMGAIGVKHVSKPSSHFRYGRFFIRKANVRSYFAIRH